MRVAYFIGSLNRGGTETLVLDTFRRRDVAPFECILIYRNDGDLTEEYRATGVSMFRNKPHGSKLGYIRKLRGLLKRERVDILHTQTLLNAFLGLFCVCFSHTKLVASFHGFFPSFKDRLLSHFVIWFADASVFVSKYVCKWYLRNTFFASKQRCHVVYNGVDFSKFDIKYPCPEFLENRASVSIGQHLNLAMVGSFVSGRSQLFICQCLKRLHDNGEKGFHFFFVGKHSKAEPELYDDCIKFCRDNGLLNRIHFLGGREDVPAILQHIDGFVYASVNDTFGIAVIEAIASGVPVLVNDWDVMCEITSNGGLADLYKSHDVEDCVTKLQKLIANNHDYKAHAVVKAGVARRKYSIEKHIQSLFQVYQKVV